MNAKQSNERIWAGGGGGGGGGGGLGLYGLAWIAGHVIKDVYRHTPPPYFVADSVALSYTHCENKIEGGVYI